MSIDIFYTKCLERDRKIKIILKFTTLALGRVKLSNTVIEKKLDTAAAKLLPNRAHTNTTRLNNGPY